MFYTPLNVISLLNNPKCKTPSIKVLNMIRGNIIYEHKKHKSWSSF